MRYVVCFALFVLFATPAYPKDKTERLIEDMNIRVCAIEFTKTLFFLVSEKMHVHPSELANLNNRDIQLLKKRFNAAFKESYYPLAVFITSLVRKPHEKDKIIESCVKRLGN